MVLFTTGLSLHASDHCLESQLNVPANFQIPSRRCHLLMKEQPCSYQNKVGSISQHNSAFTAPCKAHDSVCCKRRILRQAWSSDFNRKSLIDQRSFRPHPNTLSYWKYKQKEDAFLCHIHLSFVLYQSRIQDETIKIK